MKMHRRFKDLREDKDLKQKDVAKIINTSPNYYGDYENEKREMPFDRAIKLAEFYNVSLDYIAGRSKNKKGLTKSELPDDVNQLVENFMFLSDRRKGQIDLLMKQLVEEQENENAQIKDVI